MTVVLDKTDNVSHEWGGIAGDIYIWFSVHAGETWILEVKDEEENVWTTISSDPSPFTTTGLWWVRSSNGLKYRLSGGTVGAKAMVSNANGWEPELLS